MVALEAAKLIVRYDWEHGKCLQILRFEDHQSGLHKRTKSRFPEFPGTSGKVQELPGESGKFPEIPGQEKRREENLDLALSEDLSILKIPGDAQISARASDSDGRLLGDGVAWNTKPSNPHGNGQGLINGHAMRAHAQHAWCSPRDGLCITQKLHADFLGRSGKSEPELRAWYIATIAKFDGIPIGDDLFAFWRNEFASTFGTVTAPPVPVVHGKGNRTAAAAQRTVARRLAQGKRV
jgi:hypothetical protein